MHPTPELVLPHQGPMRMISQVLTHNSEHIHCNACIRADNPLLVGACLPAYVGIELLAQASGLLLGARRQDTDTPGPGAIVQIKSFRLQEADIPVGTTLHVRAYFEAGNTEAALFTGEVLLNDQQILEGSLMIALLEENGA
ncbi:hypothetical protein MNBD_GAMMA13-803 [hydrothermal vent metagenome]|uniref:3-hydroxyacyl-[acyl-carrier-protein] dehydratase n=1 Tax=hydrothermal vent metagenome TaxID=652676 RepID=A0A3B0YKA0_9ZZZZ